MAQLRVVLAAIFGAVATAAAVATLIILQQARDQAGLDRYDLWAVSPYVGMLALAVISSRWTLSAEVALLGTTGPPHLKCGLGLRVDEDRGIRKS